MKELKSVKRDRRVEDGMYSKEEKEEIEKDFSFFHALFFPAHYHHLHHKKKI